MASKHWPAIEDEEENKEEEKEGRLYVNGRKKGLNL